MSVLKKIFVALLVIVVLIAGAAFIAIQTIDINQYRDQIAEALSRQLGRTVKFNGPIQLAVTKHGIGVAVADATIGNPTWASRPQMASIGKLKLGVALMPLLDRKVVVSELDISDADIQLETNASNQHNWEMKPGAGAAEPAPAASQATASAPAASTVGVRVDELSVTNSQIAMRDKDGKTSTFKVTKMTLAPEGRSVTITLNADYNGAPIKLALKAGTSDLMTFGKWPYDADLTYADYHLHAQGGVDTLEKTLDLNPYEFTSGGSALHGQLMVNYAGSKTDLRGTIMGDKLDIADLKSNTEVSANTVAAPVAKTEPKDPPQLFSANPLDLSALKSANGNIDISIGELTIGKNTLKQASGRLALANGNVTLAPLKATMGASPLEGDIKLESTSPPQYSLSFKAPGVDIANLLETMGTKGFISGKGNADVQLSGSGNSLHDMAANTQGHIDITATGGSVSSAEAGGIASSLGQIFAPGSSNATLNCMAARFNVANGVAKDNGILLDSSASTVAGSGGFDLGKETIDLSLNAKPKLVDTRGLLPAVLISGSLTSPKIGINAIGEAANVAGTLLKGNKIAGALSGVLGKGADGASNTVPVIQTAPDGQNACIYSLDHKAAPATAAAPAAAPAKGVKDAVGNAGTKAKDVGNKLLQGIIGH